MEITPDMTVLDVIYRCRATESVFRSYDDRAGECICCTALFDSLRDVSNRYGIDLSEMTAKLEAAIKQAQSPADPRPSGQCPE